MPLVKETLSAGIEALLEKVMANNTPSAKKEFADGLATLIDTYVRSGTVTTNVSTLVVGVSPSGPVTGTGTGTGTGTIS